MDAALILAATLFAAAPQPRWGHAMTFDAERGVVLLHGGTAEGRVFQGDLWSFDGKAWTPLEPAGSERPPACDAHVLVHDARRKKTVLLGGRTPDRMLADTWEWDGERWERLAVPAPNPPRIHAVGADDPERGRVLVHGGVTNGNSFCRDTWSFDGKTWTREDDTGPEKAAPNGMAFDRGTRSLVLLVSLLGEPGRRALLGRSSNAWTPIGDAAPPEFEPIQPIVPMPGSKTGGLLLFDGGSGASHRFDRASGWTRLDAAGPPPRSGHAMAYDAKRDRAVLFGGGNSDRPSRMGDTWEFDGTRWRRWTP